MQSGILPNRGLLQSVLAGVVFLTAVRESYSRAKGSSPPLAHVGVPVPKTGSAISFSGSPIGSQLQTHRHYNDDSLQYNKPCKCLCTHLRCPKLQQSV